MARMEIWTGQQRRRNWSDEQKLKILQEVATSDLDRTPERYHPAADLHLAPSVFRQNQRPRTQHILPVTVAASELQEQEPAREDRARSAEQSKSTAALNRIEIRCKGGRVLKVGIGVDPAVLRDLIRGPASG